MSTDSYARAAAKEIEGIGGGADANHECGIWTKLAQGNTRSVRAHLLGKSPRGAGGRMSDEIKISTKVKRLMGVKVVCDPPSHIGRYYDWGRYPYGSVEYWQRYAKELESWVNEFDAFMRDHRSQDPVNLSVERDIRDVCSVCNSDWETQAYDDGEIACAGCGATITPAPITEPKP